MNESEFLEMIRKYVIEHNYNYMCILVKDSEITAEFGLNVVKGGI